LNDLSDLAYLADRSGLPYGAHTDIQQTLKQDERLKLPPIFSLIPGSLSPAAVYEPGRSIKKVIVLQIELFRPQLFASFHRLASR
jgi:hypothetical protein